MSPEAYDPSGTNWNKLEYTLDQNPSLNLPMFLQSVLTIYSIDYF